jgi:predicted GNAT superfamily acetyltransferase
MSPAGQKKKRDEIEVTIGPFRGSEDYSACQDIQREVWGCGDLDVVPAATLRSAEQRGGVNLGAYNRLGEMIGFATAAPGDEKGERVLHSDMLAVRSAYRNFEVGYKLKLAQRRESLKRSYGTVTWSFDPLQPLGAYFSLSKLGARCGDYVENFRQGAARPQGRVLPEDRLIATWELESKAVLARLDAGPARHDLRKELKKHPVINRLDDVAPGMPGCSALDLSCTADRLLFEIPYNLPEIRTRDLGLALEWQGKVRQAFRHYLKQGYAATELWNAEESGHPRSFYLLERT